MAFLEAQSKTQKRRCEFHISVFYIQKDYMLRKKYIVKSKEKVAKKLDKTRFLLQIYQNVSHFLCIMMKVLKKVYFYLQKGTFVVYYY